MSTPVARRDFFAGPQAGGVICRGAWILIEAGLVSSGTSADLPAFNAKVVEEVAEGKHAGHTV